MDIVYRPLKKSHTEVRLLDLDPAARFTEPLCGTLRHVRLHEASFSALSYVWGQSEEDRTNITIRYEFTTRQYLSSKFRGSSGYSAYSPSLGSSLARALRHLRKKSVKLTIWADALCIDQMDDEEKSWQVPLMKLIYSKAREVHAWLGPRYDEDVHVINHVNSAFTLADSVWTLAERVKNMRNFQNEQVWQETCLAVASPDLSSDQAQRAWSNVSTELRQTVFTNTSFQLGLASIRILSQNSYFSRMWILQETGRASKLTFHYGMLQIPHQRLLLLLGLANSLRQSQDRTTLIEQLRGFDTRFLGCLTARTTCQKQISLRDILAAAYFSPRPSHEAQDLRDIIYARLGLADDPRGIEVNYKQSVAEVYTATSQFLLLEGFMEPLVTFKPYKFQRSSFNDDLPSWAYDWSEKGSHAFGKYNAALETSQRVSITQYHAAGYKLALNMTGMNIGQVSVTNERFSATVIGAGLHESTIARGTLRAVPERPSVEMKQRLTGYINDASQQLGVRVSHEDVESLFSHKSLPFASFWCWWLHWVASLLKMMSDAALNDSSRSSPENIAELLFREVPQAVDAIKNTKRFGTRTGILDLVNYQLWSKLFVDTSQKRNTYDDHRAVQFAESLFRSAWGMRPAVLDNGRSGYVLEDTKNGD